MDVFLARQPIFDIHQRVYAYEILYRSSHINSFAETEADEASKKVMLHTFQTFGIENLTNEKPAFINFTGNLLKEKVATLFPSKFLVIEILETVKPDESIINNCKILKSMGYTIALDDFVYTPSYEPLIKLADIIKIDFLKSSRVQIEWIISRFKTTKIKFLAEKIETKEDFKLAKSLGFELFQGFYFSKPEILTRGSLLPLKVNYLHLISKTNRADMDFDEISEIISKDLSLTYNLLKLINSAAFGIRRKITSVKEALVILGQKEIRKWVTLVALYSLGEDVPDEVVRLSLIRARFAELIVSKTEFRDISDEAFLVGLLSLLDVILNRRLIEILNDIHASDEIKYALIIESGRLGTIVKIITSYEQGKWEDIIFYCDLLRLNYGEVSNAYIDALLWYNTLIQDR